MELYYSANIFCRKTLYLGITRIEPKRKKEKKCRRALFFLEYIVNAHFFHLFREYSQTLHDWTVQYSPSKRQALTMHKMKNTVWNLIIVQKHYINVACHRTGLHSMNQRFLLLLCVWNKHYPCKALCWMDAFYY